MQGIVPRNTNHDIPTEWDKWQSNNKKVHTDNNHLPHGRQAEASMPTVDIDKKVEQALREVQAQYEAAAAAQAHAKEEAQQSNAAKQTQVQQENTAPQQKRSPYEEYEEMWNTLKLMEQKQNHVFTTSKNSAEKKPGINTGKKKSKLIIRMPLKTASTGRMMSRLAKAGNSVDVQRVIASTMTEISSLKRAARTDERYDSNKVRAEIARLERVVHKSRVKIKLLKREAVVKARQKKAEKEQNKKQATFFKEELRKRKLARTTREHAQARAARAYPPSLLKDENKQSELFGDVAEAAAIGQLSSADIAGAISGSPGVAAAAVASMGGGMAASMAGGAVSMDVSI
ncbi:hypothetical protein LJB83_00840 [Clostridia bacterium OttesenSCG-928-F22]|nr:hypothetical protein [Clostridia bacterium OttesenSCG-928-F22]